MRARKYRRSQRLAGCLLLASCTSIAGATSQARAAPPAGWVLAGEPREDYDVGVDRDLREGGKPSAFIRAKVEQPDGFGTLMQTFEAGKYRGKRVRLSALIRSAKVRNWAGLWMRVDCPKRHGCAFDNMQDRAIKGDTPWKGYEVVLDVAPDAESIAFGVLQSGLGQTWINQVKIEIVDRSVPTTDLAERTLGKEPTNLDFSR